MVNPNRASIVSLMKLIKYSYNTLIDNDDLKLIKVIIEEEIRWSPEW
jgi:hypothetical protein